MKTIFNNFIIITISLVSNVISAQDSPFGDGYWILSSSTIQPALDVNLDGKPDSDLQILIPRCEKDDAERYQKDGLIILHRGMDVCEDDEEQIEESGTWTYDKKTKKLITEHYDSSKPQVFTVESVSPSEIVLVSKHQSSKGSHTIRTILKPFK